MSEPIEVNPNDIKYTDYTYKIEVLHAPTYLIHAGYLQEAIDILIDHWEKTESENLGYFLTDAEIADEEFLDEYIYGGNHCRYSSFRYHEIHVTKIDRR